jgi:hypothetical protein
MRQTLRKPHFNLSRVLAVLAMLLECAKSAHAMPLYLRLDSRFPSGNYQRSWLEAHMVQTQIQTWYQVQTRDHVTGWIAADHLLTALKLTDQAVINEDTPLHFKPEYEIRSKRGFAKAGTRVLILEVNSSWARVRLLDQLTLPDVWIPVDQLTAYIGAIPTRAFVHTATPLYVMAGVNARKIGEISDEKFVQIIKVEKHWLEVQYHALTGFIPRENAWLPIDLAEMNVKPLLSLTPMRTEPLPYAEVIRSLPASAGLKVISRKQLRWGMVHVRDFTTPMWWPIADNPEDIAANRQPTAPAIKLATKELFKRQIFDMAASRSIPSLKFVSAGGVFRTLDGESWSKIPIFHDQNYPIAIASGGPVFVGPYLSDDQGETFTQWIRWDSLIATLSRSTHVASQNLQILEIEPQDSAGRDVIVKVSVGTHNGPSTGGASSETPEPFYLHTIDQGLTWQ